MTLQNAHQRTCVQASAEHFKLRQQSASPFLGTTFSAHKEALTKLVRVSI